VVLDFRVSSDLLLQKGADQRLQQLPEKEEIIALRYPVLNWKLGEIVFDKLFQRLLVLIRYLLIHLQQLQH
jgi:hypothetical protein